MAPNQETIRIALEREIPEMRTGDGVGVLFGLLLSTVLTGGLGMGVYYFVFADGHPTGIGYLLGAGVALILGFMLGSLIRDSNDVVGAGMIEQGLQDAQSLGRRRQSADEWIALGMLLFAGSFLFGGLYNSFVYLKNRGGLGDSNSSRIGAGICAFLMQRKTATQDEVLQAFQGQAVEPQEIKDTLRLLSRAGIVGLNSERMWLHPDKRHLLI